MSHEVEIRDGVLMVVDYGTHSREEALALAEECLELVREHGLAPAPTLVDLRQADGVAPEARKVFQDFVAHEALGRIAFVTGSTFMRVAANFVTRASARGAETRFFAEPDQALQWLRA